MKRKEKEEPRAPISNTSRKSKTTHICAFCLIPLPSEAWYPQTCPPSSWHRVVGSESRCLLTHFRNQGVAARPWHLGNITQRRGRVVLLGLWNQRQIADAPKGSSLSPLPMKYKFRSCPPGGSLSHYYAKITEFLSSPPCAFPHLMHFPLAILALHAVSWKVKHTHTPFRLPLLSAEMVFLQALTSLLPHFLQTFLRTFLLYPASSKLVFFSRY